jgi:hypothetical protein
MPCDPGYHVYTPNGMDYVCQPDVYTVAEQTSEAQKIAADVNANPSDVTALFLAQFGNLTQPQQAAIQNCHLQRTNSSVFGTSISAFCQQPDAAIIQQSAPANAGGSNAPLLKQDPKTGQWVPANTPNVVAPGAAPAGPAPSGAPAGGTDKAASVAIVNKSRTGSSFFVGDSWELTVTGSPNRPVSATVTQGGQASSTATFGNTDSSGNLVVRGTMDASTVGTWKEMWTVGTAAAPVLSFTVAAAPAGSSSTSSTDSGAPGAPGAPASNSLTDFLSSTFDVFGFNVPYWAAGLVVGGVGVMALRGGKR